MIEPERKIAELKDEIVRLKAEVQNLDKAMADAQFYINQLLEKAGIEGGFQME
jgi:hypothetical protein